jgi:hypothetical protein
MPVIPTSERRLSHVLARSVCLAALLASGAATAESVSAYTFEMNGGSWEATATATIGQRVTVERPIIVTALGIVDSGTPGLASQHDVGLWSDSGTLFASGTVAAGVQARSADGFRYIDIAPILLRAGMTYRVGAVFFLGNGDNEIEAPVQTSAPAITLLDPGLAVHASGPALTFPSEFSGPNAAAANFQYHVSSVPEVSSSALLAAGLLGLTWFSLRRRA